MSECKIPNTTMVLELEPICVMRTTIPQVGKSACIVLAKERHSKGERVPFSAYTPKYTKLKPEAANTLSLMFQIFLEKNYCTP